MKKEKMSLETKTKLIYSGELAVIAIVILVLAILKFTGVMGYNETKRNVFNWITIFGGSWCVIDFVWMCCSKRKQKKNSWVDKCLALPSGLFLISFDICCFVLKDKLDGDTYTRIIGCFFLYLVAVFAFEAIYHWFKPVPSLLEAIKEEEAEQAKQEAEEAIKEENKTEE